MMRLRLSETYVLGADGRLGDRKTRKQRETQIVREVEATLMFDRATAANLRTWLGQQLDKLSDIDKKASD